MLQISDHWTRGSATHSNMLNTTPTLLTADPDMGEFKGAFSTLYSLLTCKQVTNLYTEHLTGTFPSPYFLLTSKQVPNPDNEQFKETFSVP